MYVAAASSSAFRQVPVHERYGHCALANCGGTAFHPTVTNVLHNEETGNVGFQVVWIMIERPASQPDGCRPSRSRSGPVHQVSTLVPYNPQLWRPFGVWHTADTDEQPVSGNPAFLPRVAILERYRLKLRIPVQPRHFGSRENLHTGGTNAIDQVL